MILAELEVFHSRPIAPTRRVALGRKHLPLHPAPGFSHVAIAEGTRVVHFAGQVALERDFSLAAEDLRRRVQERRFTFESEVIPVTVSLGAAELMPEMDVTAFLKAADEKLYEAKRSGRNRVCI